MSNLIAIDTETHLIKGLDAKVRNINDVPDMVCTSMAWVAADEARSNVWEYTSDSLPVALRDLLAGSATLVFHNAAFDIGVLAKCYDLEAEFREKIRRREILDTRILWANRNSAGNRVFSLAGIYRFLFGEELEKGEVRTSYRRENLPLTKEQTEYARKDAEVTLRVAQTLLSHESGGLVPRPEYFTSFQIYAEQTGCIDCDREFSATAAWQAFNVSSVGLGVDQAKVAEFRAQYEAEAAKALEAMGPFVEYKKDGEAWRASDATHTDSKRWTYSDGSMVRRCTETLRSAQARLGVNRVETSKRLTWVEVAPAKATVKQNPLRAAYRKFAEERGLTPSQNPGEGEYPISTKTGDISLDAKFWKEYRDEFPPAMRAHVEYQRASKLLGTYLNPLAQLPATEDALPRVYSSIGVGFAETGRWTHARPNLANQPGKLRELYIPGPGRAFVYADYKSLEMYTACEAFHRLGLGNGPLRNILDAGGDTHRSTAALMFGKEQDDVTDDERQAAKIANFSLLGGLGARKLRSQARANGLDWSEERARAVRDRWFEVFWDAAGFLEIFRRDPWDLLPQGYRRDAWLELQGIDPYPRPSKFDLSKKLNDGAIYECRLPSGRVVPNRRFTQACNMFFQGMGAEVISRAFNLCCDAGLRVAMVVHDSITLESSRPEDDARVLTSCMIQAEQEICCCGVKIPTPETVTSERWL